jgi:hypothetical protein
MTKKLFAFLCYMAVAGLSKAQTWDGSSGNDWNTAANWSTNAVPTVTGAVTIPNTINKPVLPSNITVATFNMNAGSAINFNGFTLTVTGVVDIREATLNNTNAGTDIIITVSSTGGGGSSYIGSNTFNDNVSVNFNGSGTSYEGYLGGNTFNGNTIFNIGGTGRLYTSYNQKSSFNGNLTINRTVAGITDLFNAGFNNITGSFIYTNSVGGDNFINSGNIASGSIGGTVNITVSGSGNPQFHLRKIKNLTPGGSISVQNSGYVFIENDTLTLAALNVNGFSGSSGDEFSKCVITGNVAFSEAASNTGSVYVGENTITGNTTITSNSAVTWYEGYQGSDVYNGNTTFNLNGTGRFYSSYNQKSSFNGNLTVTRTGIGITDLFNTGFNNITGNFSYTNNVGGDNFINSGNIASGSIGGTANITVSGSGNPQFHLRKIKNLTPGGSISVQNSGYVFIENDTLTLTALNVNGFSGSSGDEFSKCVITGNVTFSEAAANTGSVYVGENTINGNTTITSNAPVPWYESYQGSDVYNGNVTFNRTSGTGTFYIGYNDTTYANQNVTFNSIAGFDVNTSITFGGSSNTTIEQLGTQPIIIPILVMRKTDGSALTLNDSVTVTNTATFTSGIIYSGTGKELIFSNNISHTGAAVASHVVGPVTKIGDDIFTFPVGGPESYNPVTMSAPVGATSRFRAEYKIQNPTSDGFNTANKAASLGNISKAGYWNVQRLAGTTFVTLTFGFGTNPYYQFPALANLKVAQWNGTQWDDKGNGGTTGTAASGTIIHAGTLTGYGNFALANNLIQIYQYVYANPGAGPDGTPLKFKAAGGNSPYQTKKLPSGIYSADSIYLIPNASSANFKLRDLYGVEKDDTTVTAPVAPTVYIAANGNGTVNFTGWRHFVYMKNAGNQIIGAIKDSNLTLGNTIMTAYFSTPNVATAPNGNIYLKRSFKITSQFAPAGARRVRFYITKAEFNNLQAADPTAFPNGINSLTITKYTGSAEDSLFNPIPGGNSSIIPNSDITIVDLGTLYSLDIDVTDFSGFYIGGNQTNISVCSGSSVSIPSTITGATYQWQVNTGGSFTNIINGTIYSGVTTKILSLTNISGTYYNYQYRCVVNGSTNSQVYTIKFTGTWLGTVSNVWENAANWSCGILPDANTDVLINSGKPNYPQVGANTTIRTLRILLGASVLVKTGFNLTIIK